MLYISGGVGYNIGEQDEVLIEKKGREDEIYSRSERE